MGRGEELLDRAAAHQCRTGLLRVATQDVTINMSAHCSATGTEWVTGGPEPVLYGWAHLN